MSITVFNEESRCDLGAHPRFSLDIIAVHGLNGDPLRTWTEPKSQKLWLRDFLPIDLPGSRVMSFGYNATPAFENTTAGIIEHARTLLSALIEIREVDNDDNRPLVFIGHSLGGLVIKQALILAQDETLYMSIYNSLRGVIFFGTPHQGSSLAAYATVLTRIPLIFANKPSPKLLEALRRDSRALKKLTDDFRKHHGRRPYNVVTFYETRTMKGMKKLVVESSSALLTPPNEVPTFEEQIPADATHRDMCRFASRESAIYKNALRSIKRLHRGEVFARPRSEYFLVPDTVNPHFTGRLELCRRLEECLLSCSLAGFQQRFVLYGLGGSGKTQMLLKFANVHRQKYWGVFFIDASSKERATQSYLDIARACNVKETVEDVKKWLSTKSHWLLLIDNVDDPAMDISSFFPPGTTGSIIITTRNPDLRKYSTVGSFKVGEMTQGDAMLLLRKVAAIDDTANANESRSTLEVVKALEYLALAIIQAGAVIRQGICTIDGFCDLYAKHKRELLESGTPDSSKDYQYSVFTTWEISIRQIELMPGECPKLALELLRTFSFLNFSDIQESMFERTREGYQLEQRIFQDSVLAQVMPSGWDVIIWRKALGVLFAFSLITVEPSNRLSIHPLVHEWSRVRMTADQQRQAWKTAVVILAMSAPTEMTTAAQQQRRTMLPHIDAIMAHEIGNLYPPGRDLKELSLAGMRFVEIYAWDCQYDKVLGMVKADLKSKESVLHPQDLYCIDLKSQIAEAMRRSSQFKECMEYSQAIVEDLTGSGDHARMLAEKTRLGACFASLGEYQKAIDLCDEILANQDFRDMLVPNKIYMSNVLDIKRDCYLSQGNFTEAVRVGKSIFETGRQSFGETNTWTLNMAAALAITYEISKQFSQAWALHKQTLALMRETYGKHHHQVQLKLAYLSSFARRSNLNRYWKRQTIPYSEELLGLLRKPSEDPDESTVDLMDCLADDYFICGEFFKSRRLFEEVLKWKIKDYGEDHEYVKNTRKDIRRVKLLIRLRNAAAYRWWPKRINNV